MNKTIYVIIDISGSFLEEGKAGIQRNILTTIKNVFQRNQYENFEVVYLAWNDDLNLIENNTLKFNNRAKIDLIEELVENADDCSRFLFLTDGLFDDSIDKLKEILINKNSVLIPVAIGPDSDEVKLKQLSIPIGKTFEAANIITALHIICFRSFIKNVDQEKGIKKKRSFLWRR